VDKNVLHRQKYTLPYTYGENHRENSTRKLRSLKRGPGAGWMLIYDG